MYVDHAVLLAESASNLHSMLNLFKKFASNGNLK
jgi:hypothetical protein